MKRWGDVSHDTADQLSAMAVLDQTDMAVVVTDRFSNVLYWNPFAERLFGRVDDDSSSPALALGIAEKDQPLAVELATHVLRGGVWEGTFDVVRGDGSVIYVRAQAVPLRHPEGAVTGIVIMAREAMRSNEREKDRFGLLERIGERLASSLYLEETLKRVAEILVPQFADHCFIELKEGERFVRRVSTHVPGWSPPPGTWRPIGAHIEYPPGHYADTAVRRQETILVEDFAKTVHGYETTDESARLCGEIGMTSAIVAPLCARGEVLGLMYLGLSNLTRRSSPHYDTFDRDFAGAIATRVALAVDNALLFEEERRTAESFQRHLLPRELPPLDGLEIAVRYCPASPLVSHGQGIQTQVGGDWYDVIELSAGRVGIVIGDVEGRGARAAAVMGQLRAALRAFAQDDKSPADILARLDEWTRTIANPERDLYGADVSNPPIVTCQYLIYDAWSRELSFANAGHAPPLLLVDGEVDELEIGEVGQPLGVRLNAIHADLVYKEETRLLPPGSTLLLYTDGLIDRRPIRDAEVKVYSDEESLGLLKKALVRIGDSPVEDIADTITLAVPGEIDDDMAILVVRSVAQELDVAERTFPAEPIMVGEARHMAAQAFTDWMVPEERAELACLLVSEVVTNVVLHAAGAPAPSRGFGFDAAMDEPWDDEEQEEAPYPGKEFTLRLRRGAESVWVEVFDQDLRLPRIRSAGENDEGGRGLYLVDQLANRWGSRPTREGKAVWFEIPTKLR
ncbi:ATP-binding SpoIIE family protein phosphatase [Rhizohabitans arisaemae]|uniref:ATP-binding SpoIIE family protein phosphatase n=1 Tax=Rhizohabitans arisaemae TaxID=2720610 RepID=UPI0024B15794|nr:SpoIIE family protein phosphatase [Rhizohabitans arisaemae]